MTSAEIRQSFLDFFQSREHTIVPSASLLPDSPNLLFTNAGMNPFVPIFLGQRAPDVSKWAGARPGRDTRAADTQKCIRAGGKHNDLEDVGLDTYHHTFFEMLGNWSFGDYFKREAIDWAWELITEVWKFPPPRLYATVYAPDPARGDPAEFDQEARDAWAARFRAAGLDPQVHIVNGNRKDNFWMMGDTGPCGPCSELHMDLTPRGDSQGRLVNQGDARCIEIWNLVFIQFNANPDGTFSPLPARHVDTGMGFERVAGIIQNTRNFTDFNRIISNYDTDLFRPLFDQLERLSGKKYHSTLPAPGAPALSETQQADIAFRVIADHVRTLSFAIADGIEPGNTDRNYVLRRILRRAVRYGRALGFRQPFFAPLVAALAESMGSAFPELRARQERITQVIRREEETFNKTLDRGLALFEEEVAARAADASAARAPLSGAFAFRLYDEQGFPLDLTELMARERGLTVDVAGFHQLMEAQKARARAAQKKQVIELSRITTTTPTRFVGYDQWETAATVREVVGVKDKTAVILDCTPLYAEMGGQVGDTGQLERGGETWRVADTQKAGDSWLHYLAGRDAPPAGAAVRVAVDRERRAAIQRHHTATHLLHWALHEVVSPDAVQKGSFVGPEKLTFDFNGAPLTPRQVADLEQAVNERILENAPVTWTEARYQDLRNRPDIRQCFGEKYGDVVRVLQVGGQPGALNGYSMELCGGTHVRATGEIGLFRITAESAIAAGIRRIEALAGLEACRRTSEERQLLRAIADKVNSPLGELEKKIEALLAQQRALEKQLLAIAQERAAQTARNLLSQAQTLNGTPALIARFDADGEQLQGIANELKGQFQGVIILGGVAQGAVSLVAAVAPAYAAKYPAGKIIQTLAPLVGGKGGGRPDNARGGGKDTSKLDEALARARSLLSGA